MNFSKNIAFVAVAVLVVFSGQSDAGITSFLSHGFDFLQTAGSIAASVIEEGISVVASSIKTQIDEVRRNRPGEKAIAAVTKQASEARAVSANEEAIDVVLKGLVDTINGIKIAGDAAYDGVKIASETKDANPEVIVKAIDESITKAKELIGTAGLKTYLALGAATEICEAGARPILNEAIQIVTGAGITAYKGFESVKSIAVNGVQAGEDAIRQALSASVKAIQATVESTDQILIMVGKKAFQAIIKESHVLDEKTALDLARDQAAEGSPKCQSAIEKIHQIAEDSIQSLLSAPQIAAAKVIQNGLVDACKSIANAVQPGYKSMEEAESIPNEETALATVQNGVGAARRESIAAVAYGHQAMGGAAYIIGQSSSAGTESLKESIKLLEQVRAQISNGLDAALTFATQGIQSTAAEAGLEAGLRSVASTGFSAYAELENIAKIAFSSL